MPARNWRGQGDGICGFHFIQCHNQQALLEVISQGQHLLEARPRLVGMGSRTTTGTFENRKKWCQRQELNLRPKAYESSALPLSYAGKVRLRIK
jgi:hypothetical protein